MTLQALVEIALGLRIAPTYLRYERTFNGDDYGKKESITTRVRRRALTLKLGRAIYVRLDPLVRTSTILHTGQCPHAEKDSKYVETSHGKLVQSQDEGKRAEGDKKPFDRDRDLPREYQIA